MSRLPSQRGVRISVNVKSFCYSEYGAFGQHSVPYQGVPTQNQSHGPMVPTQESPQVRTIPTEGLHGSVPTQVRFPSQPPELPPQTPSQPKLPSQDDALARERAELEKERKRLADEQQKHINLYT